MSMMHRLRLYHAFLAVLVLAAYVSAEWGLVHAWLGYGVAMVILFRLGLALTGAPQLGLIRFYPQFKGLQLGNVMTHPAISKTLLLGIACCLVGVMATGIALDRGRAIGLAQMEVVATATADDDDREEAGEGSQEEGEESEVFEEAHEFFGNFLMLLVVVHVAYVLAFKRPLALFMLFADAGIRSQRDQVS